MTSRAGLSVKFKQTERGHHQKAIDNMAEQSNGRRSVNWDLRIRSLQIVAVLSHLNPIAAGVFPSAFECRATN